MTCQRALSLLDEYVDGELSMHLVAEVETHIAQCDGCRSEYHRAVRLKELLKQRRVRDPGRDYWSEVTELILARTQEDDRRTEPQESPVAVLAARRGAFVRALVSLAASLAILTSAIFIGQNQQSGLRATADGSMLVSRAVSEQIPSSGTIVSRAEHERIARGMRLLGTPGILGRFSGITEFETGLAGYGF